MNLLRCKNCNMGNDEQKKILRFILVGIFNTLLGNAVMFFLYNFFHASYWFSTSFGYVVGGGLSYLLNKLFTFKNQERSFRQLLFFIISIIICYVISFYVSRCIGKMLLCGVDKKIRENFSMFFGMILYATLNYLSLRFIVFNNRRLTENDKSL